MRAFGRLDIIINNASLYLFSLALQVTEELWDKVLDINLKGLSVGYIVLNERERIGDIISDKLGPESHHKTTPPQVCSEQITAHYAVTRL